MSYRKIGVFSLVFLLFLSTVSAIETFHVEVTPITDLINVNETAAFDIKIINGFSEEREFKIDKVGYPFWDMFTDPLANPITLEVGPNQNGTIRLLVRPIHISVVDTYSLDTQVTDLTTEKKRVAPITVGIRSVDNLIEGYVPTVLTSVRIPEVIDPRESVPISITFNNQNVLNYPELNVRVSSSLFAGEYTYTLGPKEEKTVTLTMDIDPLTTPQSDDLVVAVFRENRSIITPITTEFSIDEYVVEEELGQTSSFLKTTTSTRLSSNNPEYKGLVKKETNGWDNLFTTTSPNAARIEENGQDYLVWNIELEGNEMVVSTTQNFRPLVIIILVVFILLGLYYALRSPLVISKEVASVVSNEGGVREIKVLLKLRNRGKESLKQIEVADSIPRLAKFEKEMPLGALQPEKVTHSQAKGTILRWNVESLDANEGVILSYRMKSRLAILGEFNLPAATARVHHGKAYVITNSNRTTVSQ